MKLTKKLLNEHNIFNPYDVAHVTGTKNFVDYVPADNGRLTSHYAYWQSYYLVDNAGNEKRLQFTVTCRENKEPQRIKAVQFVNGKYKLNLTDKDPFGAYHPEGTLAKLRKLIEDKNV